MSRARLRRDLLGRIVLGSVLLAGGAAMVSAQEVPALTGAEQAATAQMLDKVGNLSGPALASEVVRLTKLYGDQNFNVKGILALVKAGAGQKQGAVTIALQKACTATVGGPAELRYYCDGAEVASAAGEPSASPIQPAAIDTAGVQTSAFGAGGGGGGGGGVTVSNSGSGVGNGTSGTVSAGATAGTNPVFSLATTRSTSSSVGSTTTSAGGVTYYVISNR